MRNNLYNRSNINGTPDKIILRILTKHGLGMESDYLDLKTNSSEFGDNEKMKNVEDGVSIYERMQKNYSKNWKIIKKYIRINMEKRMVYINLIVIAKKRYLVELIK